MDPFKGSLIKAPILLSMLSNHAGLARRAWPWEALLREDRVDLLGLCVSQGLGFRGFGFRVGFYSE